MHSGATVRSSYSLTSRRASPSAGCPSREEASSRMVRPRTNVSNPCALAMCLVSTDDRLPLLACGHQCELPPLRPPPASARVWSRLRGRGKKVGQFHMLILARSYTHTLTRTLILPHAHTLTRYDRVEHITLMHMLLLLRCSCSCCCRCCCCCCCCCCRCRCRCRRCRRSPRRHSRARAQ